METVTIYKKQANIPTSWNELTQDQYLFIMNLFVSSTNMDYIKTAALKLFLDIDWKKFVNLNSKGRAELIHFYLSWIQETPKFSENPLKKISLGLHHYIAPMRALQDFTFQQFFEYTEQLLIAYSKLGDESLLDKLCTSVYIAERNGAKESFSDYNFGFHEQNFKRASLAIKRGIFYVYLNERDKVVERYKKLFTGKKSKEKFDFVKLVDGLNLGKIADNEKIKNAYLFEACQRLTKLIEEQTKDKKR